MTTLTNEQRARLIADLGIVELQARDEARQARTQAQAQYDAAALLHATAAEQAQLARDKAKAAYDAELAEIAIPLDAATEALRAAEDALTDAVANLEAAEAALASADQRAAGL